MKNPHLRAYRTLAGIRARRQEALDRERMQQQSTLVALVEAAQQKAQAVGEAQQHVADQVERIARLLVSGNRFQVADYLSQQDYQAWLEAKVGVVRAEQGQADGAVAEQETVLKQARVAAARNLEQCRRLDERIRQIRIDQDVAQMDSEDEESEEASVGRRKIEALRAALEAQDTEQPEQAALSDHA